MAESYLDILADTIHKNWNQPALTDFYLTEDGISQDTSRGHHYTYGEMYAEIVRVADLLTNLGLQKGDHIAICGANSAHWVIAYLAIAKIQGVSVTVMHSLQPDQIAQMVDFSDAKALFINKELWVELKELSLPQIEHVISLDDWSVLYGDKSSLPYREELEVGFPLFDPDSLAMICFTSGTMGEPKGVMLSIESLSNNISYKIHSFDKYHSNHIMTVLPFAHIYGLAIELMVPLCVGTLSHIIASNLFSTNGFIGSFNIIKPRILFLIPSIANTFIINIKSIQEALADLDFISIAGAKLSLELENALIQNKIGICTGYGVTECASRITLALPEEHKKGTVGTVVDGLILHIAQNGEILVKGKNVMLGYYKDPEATAAKIDANGWLHTGDKGHLDEDGYLYVEGRLEQDMIVLPNGENIRPDNIEALINALPEVSESIVLARDGKLVAIAVLSSPSLQGRDRVRLSILRAVNPQLPLFSQLYDVEITDKPLARTEKQTLKRYLYK